MGVDWCWDTAVKGGTAAGIMVIADGGEVIANFWKFRIQGS